MELILTWLWQGSALALLMAVALRLRPTTGAGTRYLLWWAVLIAIVTLPWAGMLPLLPAPTTGVVGAGTPGGETASAAPGLVTIAAPSVWLLTLTAAGWLGLVAVRLFTLARGVDHLRRLRQRSWPMRPDRELALTRWMTLRHHGRRTRLRVSDDVLVPSLLGLGRPVVVLPRPILDALSADELDHVVVHEYAHAQRWDDWTLLVQSVVSAILGLHPGVWVATGALDRERELACDDWVIARGGCRRVYALSVTKVAEMAMVGTAPALAPGMAGSRGAITRRVERLLDPSRSGEIRPSRLVLSVGIGVLSVALVLLGALPPVLATARPNSADGPSRPAAQDGARPAPTPTVSVSPIPIQTASVRPAQTRTVSVRSTPTRTTSASPASARRESVRSNRNEPADRVGAETNRLLDGPSPQEPLTPRDTAVPPRALEARAHAFEQVPLAARMGATSWPPAPVLTSRPTVQTQIIGLIAVPAPVSEPSPWRKMADGGQAIGSKAAAAGQATAGAFTRFGSAIARAFTGGT